MTKNNNQIKLEKIANQIKDILEQAHVDGYLQIRIDDDIVHLATDCLVCTAEVLVYFIEENEIMHVRETH